MPQLSSWGSVTHMATDYRVPVETELETIDININVGPQHPATHGVFRMVLTVDGGLVTELDPVIGYMHRGNEKLPENCDYRQVIGYHDRTDYLAQFNTEHCYVEAVEKLAGITAPERAEDIHERCKQVLAAVKRGIEQLDALMMENEVVLARCRGLSPVSPADAIDWGLSGPMLRSTGLKDDIRGGGPGSRYDPLR